MILRRPTPPTPAPGRRGAAVGALPVRPAPRGILMGALVQLFSRFTGLAILIIVGAHVVLGIDDDPIVMRVLLAVPAVLFVLEVRRYLRSEARELPFLPLVLLQFYTAFGFAVFFDLPFYDLGGRVFFGPATRVAGGVAVALGALSLSAGARLGMRLGGELRGALKRVLPPDTRPSRWDDALYVYAGACVLAAVLTTFFTQAIPVSLSLAVFYMFPLEMALGLAVLRPPRALGQRAGQIILAIGVAMGVLRGQLEPVGRTCVAFISVRWVVTRKIAIGIIMAMVALYVVLQPAKHRYREQVWGHAAKTNEELGVSGRLDAWEVSLADTFSGDATHAKEEGSSMSRLSELEATLHALEVVPGRVDYAYGESLMQLLYAPIPRLLWPDKPVSKDEVGQRYAVIFGRQTDQGAQTTAIGMSLLVEGYWNFGWIGIVLYSGAIGLLVGAWQRTFVGEHWALGTIGVAQIASVQASVPVVVIYGQLFQSLAGRLMGVWLIFLVAQILSKKARRGVPVRRLAGG
jgi:hypothetical protein